MHFGGNKTIRGRMSKAVFDTVTLFAEAEKGMGNKKPVPYTVYCVLACFIAVLGFIILIPMLLLFGNGTIFPNMFDDIFTLFHTGCWYLCSFSRFPF